MSFVEQIIGENQISFLVILVNVTVAGEDFASLFKTVK